MEVRGNKLGFVFILMISVISCGRLRSKFRYNMCIILPSSINMNRFLLVSFQLSFYSQPLNTRGGWPILDPYLKGQRQSKKFISCLQAGTKTSYYATSSYLKLWPSLPQTSYLCRSKQKICIWYLVSHSFQLMIECIPTLG